MFHMDLGLSRVQSALDALGLSLPACPRVQVVGTNGKGSTSTFLARMLTASGLKTGLYTSPHFLSPRERILVDGAQAPDELWLEAAEAVLTVSQDRSQKLRLTYFELLTVMAAWLFRETGCRAAVFEAGLGGEHDATSALAHNLLAITPIGLDHVAILGPALADIARDKALAMREGVPAVSADQDREALRVISEVAAEIGAPLHLAREVEARAVAEGCVWPDTPGMPGPHQADNLRLALAAFHLLATDPSLAGRGHAGRPDLPGDHAQRDSRALADPRFPDCPGFAGIREDPEALRLAARLAFIPGRFQIVPAGDGLPELVLDGAHNEPGLACLARAVESLRMKPRALIFACLVDKDLKAMLPWVRELTGGPIIVPGLAAHGRALDPAELAARIGGNALPVADMAEALEMVRGSEGPVLVCGSLYLLAEAYRLKPEWLNRPE